MPVLSIDDTTEFLFRNLIAYEQSFETQSYVTSYAIAIDMLVNTQDDVAKRFKPSSLSILKGSSSYILTFYNVHFSHIHPLGFLRIIHLRSDARQHKASLLYHNLTIRADNLDPYQDKMVDLVENFLENVPEFWSSREFADTLKDGDILYLDMNFFINMFLRLMYKEDMEEIWKIINEFLMEEYFSSLCSHLLITRGDRYVDDFADFDFEYNRMDFQSKGSYWLLSTDGYSTSWSSPLDNLTIRCESFADEDKDVNKCEIIVDLVLFMKRILIYFIVEAIKERTGCSIEKTRP
ncbi:hypothetical protein E3N88_31660 [Mikania micrantha]|uniref:Uncharacterized protein n=1 Tax=Mikania micrantha TaxID=192012 RepID=A0A5N6M7D3_9ASTR|nr:hypothetical protein E3N88_31660 [Mikania micrantha]